MDRPIQILLVEDNDDDVEILRRFIRRIGGEYEILVAQTGAEALTLLERNTPDLALLDQHLPDVTGERLIAKVRAVQERLPIVMLTGQGDERLAVQVMKAGAYDYLRKDDLDRRTLGRVIHNVLERSRLEAEVRAAEIRFRDWAIRDGLTGLYNHRHFQELLSRDFATAKRYGSTLAALMLDLDHFKQVNDSHGHLAGDAVLREVAARLQAAARSVDVIARYGGEEFVLLLPSTDGDGALQLASRICSMVAVRPIETDGRQIRVTVSIGVATSVDPGADDARCLLELADKALYAAKRSGRNRVARAGAHAPVSTLELPVVDAGSDVEFEARRRLVGALSAVVQLADTNSSRKHANRAAQIAQAFGRFLRLDPAQQEVLRVGALLHDIGRVGVSDAIMAKGGELSEAERAVVREHPTKGAEVLRLTGLLDAEAKIALHHHERWDGEGYPGGLSGQHIPRLARIVTIVDAFEALTSRRPWRDRLTRGAALAALIADAGRIYDPELIETFRAFIVEAERD